MDATLYLQRLKEEISTLREEKELLKNINDIDVIDAFEVRVKKKNPLKSEKVIGEHYSFTIDEPMRFVSDITNEHLNFRYPHEEN